MKKGQPLPRRPSTAPSGSAQSSAAESSFNLRSLDDNLPGPSSSSTYTPPRTNGPPSPKLPKGSPPATKPPSPRVSVSSHPTVSSSIKQTAKKEVGTPTKSTRAPPSIPPSKRPTTPKDGVKKSASVYGKEAHAVAASLPMDSLCLCLEKLESVYHVVTCAAVCQHWREAARLDVVWKSLYLRWWQEPQDKADANSSSQQVVMLPTGCDSWRDAFIAKYSSGKRKMLSKEVAHGVNAGWLHLRRMRDKHGKQVKDCTPGDSMQRLVERLGLTFHVCVNRDAPVRLKGKANVVYFPASCLLRYPTKARRGGLSLSALNSFKVTATSDKLLQTFTVASFPGRNWEMVSREGVNPGPLRLLQQTPTSSASLIVGTLFEGVDGTDGFSLEEHGQEQILLLMASLHLSDLIWRVMELGEGLAPQTSRRIHHDHMDPFYGLHDWHVSIQLHTFGKLLWSQKFPQVFWSPRESIAGQKAVFLLIATHELFPGMLNSPWRTEVFSGELRGVFMLDFTLWDEDSEIAWHCTRAVRTNPAELATVEYGPPGTDGERVHTRVHDEKQGVSVSMNLCIPFADGWNTTADAKSSVVITDLRFSLSSKFLLSWFGRSTV